EMQGHAADGDAELLGVADGVGDFGGMQVLFCWDAAAQEAGASEVFVSFNDRGFQSQLRGADGCRITTRPRADHSHIELFGHFSPSLRLSVPARSPGSKKPHERGCGSVVF